jgi:hypothetical protein
MQWSLGGSRNVATEIETSDSELCTGVLLSNVLLPLDTEQCQIPESIPKTKQKNGTEDESEVQIRIQSEGGMEQLYQHEY